MSDPPSDAASDDAVARRAAAEIDRQLGQALSPGLYLVSTPIGNLADITLRALSTLSRADVIYCEDTRHSRTLLAHYGIRTTLRAYHEHNAEEERPRIMRELAGDRRIALISDAGTPLVSDPGFKLVREAAETGIPVTAIPGASAVLASLTIAGLPTDAFFFAGFLPSREGARKTRIEELAAVPGTLVFFEAPTRAAATLADLASVLGDRPAALARELTKLHEDVRRATLSELHRHYDAEPPKGEVVILVAPPVLGNVTDDMIKAGLAPALEALSVRDAARTVAAKLNVPKARVYDLALGMKRRDDAP